MQIAARYSHLNGEEFLIVRHPELWKDVKEVVASIDAESCRNKVSKERGQIGRMLYSPVDLNNAFKQGLEARGWRQRRRNFWVTSDEKVLRQVAQSPPDVQREAIERAGLEPIMTFNQTDFVKNRVAIEVQFGKYAFVAHDLFVKHMSFFVSDIIDVGIEILPMKEMEQQMSSGVPYYERDLLNVMRQGRNTPAVPLVLLGIAPDEAYA